jgi:hypothetical protein
VGIVVRSRSKKITRSILRTYFLVGTPLYGGALSKDGEIESVVMRAGIFDDQGLLSRCKPVVEIYTTQRLEWVDAVEGCMQFEGMLSS